MKAINWTHQIRRKLAQGGHAEVFVAFDTHLKRDVALKVLPESSAKVPDSLEHNKTSTPAALRPLIAASRTPPWLPSGWGCRGRRLSRA
jgi:serine/threonine protein kinase